jgi:hypothetical protein
MFAASLPRAGHWSDFDSQLHFQPTTEATMRRFVLAVCTLLALGAGIQASAAEEDTTSAASEDTAAAPDTPAMATDTPPEPAASEPSADPTPADGDSK